MNFTSMFVGLIVIKNEKFNAIANIINNEDKTNPLDDSQIQDLLAKKGIKMDPRMIGRYRMELNCPNHNERKEDKYHQLGIFSNNIKPSKKYPIRTSKNDKDYSWFYVHIAIKKDKKAMIYGRTSLPNKRRKDYIYNLKNGWKIVYENAIYAMGEWDNCGLVEQYIKYTYKSYLTKKDMKESFTESIEYSDEAFEDIRMQVIRNI